MAKAARRRGRSRFIYLLERLGDLLESGREPVHFVWWRTNNWGDALNPMLIRAISGRPVRGWDIGALRDGVSASHGRGVPKHLVIGSTLGHANQDVTVWGAGFMYEDEQPAGPPREVRAVRGPLSARRLTALGCSSSAVFGDPALLCPDYFSRSTRVTYDLGIVLHESESGAPYLRSARRDPRVKVIDIRSGVRHVIREVTSCARIASSSLHGIVLADAYEIPWTWVFAAPAIRRQAFKFEDYFASTGRTPEAPLLLAGGITADDLIRAARWDKPRLDLDPLREACPFA